MASNWVHDFVPIFGIKILILKYYLKTKEINALKTGHLLHF